jgi:FlgD Ig-like domain/PQQ-like domain
VFKLDGMTGEVLWSQHYASPEGINEAALGMALDSQDNVFITGRAIVGAQNEQALTMKLAGSDGDILWMDTFGGSAAENDISWDIVVGSDDHPVISGFVVETGGVANYFVRKMNNTNGDVIWDKRGPQAQNNYSSRGTWLSLMDNDDVVMCQRVFGANGYDVYLHRFSGMDGTTAWSRVYDNPTHSGDDPKAMSTDPDGNLLIAGVQDLSWNYNFMALKIDGINGETLWVSNYDGPPGWYDVANSITTAPDGSVITSGLSDGTGTGWDWATVAFDGTDGHQLWDIRFDGPTSQSDEPGDMIINSDSEIFVTGYGYGQDSNKDMFTICYEIGGPSAVGDMPAVASLSGAWPNPFNPRINLSFDLPQAAHARLAVFDLRGRQVTTLVNGNLDEGTHTTSWDGRDHQGRAVPAGVYLAIMESGEVRSTRKIVLAK